MEILVAGDFHFDLVLSGYDYYKDIINAVNQLIDDTINADLLVLLGDIFNSARPTPRAYGAVIELLYQMSCPVVIIAGNHDISVSEKCNSLYPLKQIDFHNDIKIVDTPVFTRIQNKQFLFLPYINDSQAIDFCGKTAQELVNQSFDDALQMEGDLDAIFTHLDIDGIKIGTNSFLRGGNLFIPINRIKDIKCYIFNGHIHKRSVQGNNTIWLPGSIVNFGFSDIYTKKGYIKAVL